MRAVNLLPRDNEQKRNPRSLPILVACGASVLAVAVLAVTYLQASSSVGTASTELAAAKSELAALPPPAAPPATVGALPSERQARTTALAAALGQRVAWDRVLREVSLVLPDDVWLTELDAAADAPGDFHISGYTYSQSSVARLLSRLSVIPDLADVALTSANSSVLANRSVVSFAITATVRAPGATS